MIWWHCCIEMEDAEQRTEDVVATISRHILGWEQPGDRDAVIESHGTLKIRLTCTLMLKVLFFHALEYLDRLGCWCGSPKDYSNHWPSLTFMGNTAPTEKQENRVWVAQGKSTILCHFGLLTALMKLITTISSSPSSCCSSTPPPRCPQYPEMYTGSNEVWGDVTMLTITDFSLDHIMLLVFATLISPSPSIRCSFIYHSLHAAIVFSRIVDSVYLVCIHNGWWFSYPVIWFGPSEGRNDKASWLWPSSRPNQILLILMDYCTWQFLVSLSTSKICRFSWLGLPLPKYNSFCFAESALCNSRWYSISSSQATLFSALDNKTMSWRGERPLLEPQTCALLDESHGVLDHLPVQGVDLLEGEGDHPVPPSEPRSIQVTTPIYKAKEE